MASPTSDSQPPKPSNGERQWGSFMRNRLWLQTIVIILLILTDAGMIYWLLKDPAQNELLGVAVGALTSALGIAAKDYFNPED